MQNIIFKNDCGKFETPYFFKRKYSDNWKTDEESIFNDPNLEVMGA